MTQIYKITNKIDNKCYIGQTNRGINTRFIEHKCRAKRNPKYLLHLAMQEFGVSAFMIEILKECNNSEEACVFEQTFISEFDSTNPDKGYNKSKGGLGLRMKPTQETIEKIREKAKLRGISDKCREASIAARLGNPVSENVAELNRNRGMKCAKEVIMYDIDGNYLADFVSIIEASRQTGLDRRTIQRQLHGEYKLDSSARSRSNTKYLWKYKNQLT
ncbi:MAG: hypothetical protein EOM35_06355 [Negativicutes bacterium]|nr:hypothetical protein [Negativicutes bacterium]